MTAKAAAYSDCGAIKSSEQKKVLLRLSQGVTAELVGVSKRTLRDQFVGQNPDLAYDTFHVVRFFLDRLRTTDEEMTDKRLKQREHDLRLQKMQTEIECAENKLINIDAAMVFLERIIARIQTAFQALVDEYGEEATSLRMHR